MVAERSWAVRFADNSEGAVRMVDAHICIDPSDGTRPLLRSRMTVALAHVGVTADAPYGTLCTISEEGLDRAWRILSNMELTLAAYNAPDTTDLKYDLYMAPELFEDFVSALGVGHGAEEWSPSSSLLPVTEFQATKHRGFLFVLKLIACMSGSLLLVGGAVFLFAEFFPEHEEDAVMALVVLIPFMSFGLVWGILHARGPHYQIRIAPGEVVISRAGRPERITIVLKEAVALPANWVSSGRYGRRRMGPAYVIVHGNQIRTRIALGDPEDMWEDKVPEMDEPHFVISRQAWDALLRVVT